MVPISTSVFIGLVTVGLVFLVYVFVQFCRETRRRR